MGRVAVRIPVVHHHHHVACCGVRILACVAERDLVQRRLVIGQRRRARQRQNAGADIVARRNNAGGQRPVHRQHIGRLVVRQGDRRRLDVGVVHVRDGHIRVHNRHRRAVFGERRRVVGPRRRRVVHVQVQHRRIVNSHCPYQIVIVDPADLDLHVRLAVAVDVGIEEVIVAAGPDPMGA